MTENTYLTIIIIIIIIIIPSYIEMEIVHNLVKKAAYIVK